MHSMEESISGVLHIGHVQLDVFLTHSHNPFLEPAIQSTTSWGLNIYQQWYLLKKKAQTWPYAIFVLMSYKILKLPKDGDHRVAVRTMVLVFFANIRPLLAESFLDEFFIHADIKI